VGTYFTADTHLGHEPIIEKCARPFSNLREMHEVIRRNWNEIVGPDDTVYHLGDVALRGRGMSSAELARYLASLNGRIVVLRGNYDSDRTCRAFRQAGVSVMLGRHVVSDEDGLQYSAGHYPPVSKTARDLCAPFQRDPERPVLAGHLHATRPANRFRGFSWVDVGVDANDYAPLGAGDVYDLWQEALALDRDTVAPEDGDGGTVWRDLTEGAP